MCNCTKLRNIHYHLMHFASQYRCTTLPPRGFHLDVRHNLRNHCTLRRNIRVPRCHHVATTIDARHNIHLQSMYGQISPAYMRGKTSVVQFLRRNIRCPLCHHVATTIDSRHNLCAQSMYGQILPAFYARQNFRRFDVRQNCRNRIFAAQYPLSPRSHHLPPIRRTMKKNVYARIVSWCLKLGLYCMTVWTVMSVV